MSDFATLYAEALDLFDEPSRSKFSKDSGTLAYRMLNRLYKEVCRKTRCHRDSSHFHTTDDVREYDFPTTSDGKLVVVQRLVFMDTGWTQGNPLTFLPDFNQINEVEGNDGPPKKYYVTNEKIGLVPLPDDTYQINWWGFIGPSADLTSSGTPDLIPSDFHYVLADGLTYWFYRIDKGDTSDGAIKWRGIYEEGLRDLKDYCAGLDNDDLLPGVE